MSAGEGCLDVVDCEGVERVLRERLASLDPTSRAELLHALMLDDQDRARRIREFLEDPRTQAFAELLMNAEEDPYVRAVLVGMPREPSRGSPGS